MSLGQELKDPTIPNVWDLGDISVECSQTQRYESACVLVESALCSQARLVTLGGGHDYGYPDALGFLQAQKKRGVAQKPLILNIDAHLDVRPPGKVGFSSGTPFYRLLSHSDFQAKRDFDFVELGIQNHCNARSHLQWALDRGACVHLQDTLRLSPTDMWAFLKESVSFSQKTPVFLSLDIDGFSSTVAPGASASYPTGLPADVVFRFLRHLFRETDVRHMGIYEVAPPLDIGGMTVQLAALLLHRFLFL